MEYFRADSPQLFWFFFWFICFQCTGDLYILQKRGNTSVHYWFPGLKSLGNITDRTIALISHASKVMLKILQARLQQYVIMNFQMFKLVLGKAEEPELKLPTSTGSSKKQESSRKTSISALLTMPKPLTVWITINCAKF